MRVADATSNSSAKLYHRLPQLTDAERELWLLDHRINQRGIPIDRDLARAIAQLVKKQRLLTNEEISAITGGAVTTASQCARIIGWLAGNGIEFAGLTKAHAKAALANGLDGHARRLFELRRDGSLASVRILDGLDADDRLRELFVYHGAAPGRWTGRGAQPQTLPKVGIREVRAEDANLGHPVHQIGARVDCGNPFQRAIEQFLCFCTVHARYKTRYFQRIAFHGCLVRWLITLVLAALDRP
jgi:hypothetical protein